MPGRWDGENHSISTVPLTNTLRFRLEARAPALRCHRAYEITVGQDLFGIWVAEMTYGRIGAVG